MFSSGGFGAFGQPAGYGFDFPGAHGGVNGYSQWGQVGPSVVTWHLVAPSIT